MGADTPAQDWKVAGQVSLGGASYVGAGGWVFLFQSDEAQHSESFVLYGAGIGLGGSMGGASLPDSPSGGNAWTRLRCHRPFSADDLHNARGEIINTSAGLALGLGLTRLTGSTWDQSLFDSEPFMSANAGVALGGFAMVGIWRRLSAGHMQR